MMIMNSRKFIAVLTSVMFFVMQFAVPVELRAQMVPVSNETNSPAPTISPSNVKTSSENIPNPNDVEGTLSAAKTTPPIAPYGDPMLDLRVPNAEGLLKLPTAEQLVNLVKQGIKTKVQINEAIKNYTNILIYAYNQTPNALVGNNYALDANNNSKLDISDILTVIYIRDTFNKALTPSAAFEVLTSDYMQERQDTSNDGVNLRIYQPGLSSNPGYVTALITVMDGTTVVTTQMEEGIDLVNMKDILVKNVPFGKKLNFKIDLKIYEDGSKTELLNQNSKTIEHTTFGVDASSVQVNGMYISGKILGWDPLKHKGSVTWNDRFPAQQTIYKKISFGYTTRNARWGINEDTGSFWITTDPPVYVDGKAANIPIVLEVLQGARVDCAGLQGCTYYQPTYKRLPAISMPIPPLANPVFVTDFYDQQVPNSSSFKFLAKVSNVPAGAKVMISYRKTPGVHPSNVVEMVRGTNGVWSTGNISGLEPNVTYDYALEIHQAETPGSAEMRITQRTSGKPFAPNQVAKALEWANIWQVTSSTASGSVPLSFAAMKFTTGRVYLQKNGVWQATPVPLTIQDGAGSFTFTGLDSEVQYNYRVEVLTLAGYVASPIKQFKTLVAPKVLTAATVNQPSHQEAHLKLTYSNWQEIEKVKITLMYQGQVITSHQPIEINFKRIVPGGYGFFVKNNEAYSTVSFKNLTADRNYDILVEVTTTAQKVTKTTFPSAVKSLPSPDFVNVDVKKTVDAKGDITVTAKAVVSNVNSKDNVLITYRLPGSSVTQVYYLAPNSKNPNLFELTKTFPKGTTFLALQTFPVGAFQKFYNLHPNLLV